MFKKILGKKRRRQPYKRKIEKSFNNDLYCIGQDLFDFAKNYADKKTADESCDNNGAPSCPDLLEEAYNRTRRKK